MCGGLSISVVLSSTLYVYVCHICGTLPAHWVCRVFSEPWGIVELARTPHAKKKKKNECDLGRSSCFLDLVRLLSVGLA